jgi:hypothetical protein
MAQRSTKSTARKTRVRRTTAIQKGRRGKTTGQVKKTARKATSRKTTRITTGQARASTWSAGAAAGATPDQASVVPLRDRLEGLVEGLGNNRVAELLEVSRSQPSRWRRQQEGIGPENQRRVLDLDYVMSRLLQLYPKEQAHIWLQSHNSHLGARPLDVLRSRGAGPVVDAIDAEAEGAYA